MTDMPGDSCESGFSIVYLGFLGCLIHSNLIHSNLIPPCLKSWLERGSPPEALFYMGGLNLQPSPHFTCGGSSVYSRVYSRPITRNSICFR